MTRMPNTKAKDNSSRDQDRYNKLIQEEVNRMPDYVRDYQIETNHSVLTEYQYLTEFRRFFDWLRSAEYRMHLIISIFRRKRCLSFVLRIFHSILIIYSMFLISKVRIIHQRQSIVH